VSPSSVWISGTAQTGKTTALIEQLVTWLTVPPGERPAAGAGILVFATNADNRSVLHKRILYRTQGQGAITTTTPLAFFENELLLFWPLILETYRLKGYFPIRLRPETEQVLAIALWGETAISTLQQWEPATPDRWVRRVLDAIQLSAFAGIRLEFIGVRLQSLCQSLKFPAIAAPYIQTLALEWQNWCLERGLLTYGLITDLYWRSLLPHPEYQTKLRERFWAIAADDLDNYPAVTGQLFATLLESGYPGVFTYDPLGGIRQGLGADPDALKELAQHCRHTLDLRSPQGLDEPSTDLNELFQSITLQSQPACYSLRTITRIQMLQEVAQGIMTAIHSGEVLAADIALLAPGLDSLARHTLQNQFSQAGIAVESLRDQRPLQTDVMVRALLTLLALLYPNLGHLLNREQIAEMLVILTVEDFSQPNTSRSRIDPVRAALLADYCFRPHPQTPELLPAETFPRWDRLGYVTTQAYTQLCQWIQRQKTQTQGQASSLASTLIHSALPPKSTAYLTLNPVYVLDRAIQTFLMTQPLSVDQLAVLREFMETAQHFWDINGRLRQVEGSELTLGHSVEQFIQLLRRGVITANPYPVDRSLVNRDAVTLATTYQYLNARLSHRWQFWLDVGSPLWIGTGTVPLWGASAFLQQPDTFPNTREHFMNPAAPLSPVQMRLSNALKALIARSQERIYFCHSDLAANGQAQFGLLLPWVEMALPTSNIPIPF
jgi:hypothetical protein